MSLRGCKGAGHHLEVLGRRTSPSEDRSKIPATLPSPWSVLLQVRGAGQPMWPTPVLSRKRSVSYSDLLLSFWETSLGFCIVKGLIGIWAPLNHEPDKRNKALNPLVHATMMCNKQESRAIFFAIFLAC